MWKGTASVLKLGRPQPIVVAVPAGAAARLQTQAARPDPLIAPFAKGQSVGSLQGMLDGKPLADVPLQALEPVEQAGFIGRATDTVRMWF